VKRLAAPTLDSSVRNLGRWKPHDDLLLIQAVEQVSEGVEGGGSRDVVQV